MHNTPFKKKTYIGYEGCQMLYALSPTDTHTPSSFEPEIQRSLFKISNFLNSVGQLLHQAGFYRKHIKLCKGPSTMVLL